MRRLDNITDEQIAAAQLRLVIDDKLGRDTPEVLRRIAAMSPTEIDDVPAPVFTGPHSSLLDALGVPLSSELLTRALTHRSYTEETGEHLSNDRLEFLGDAMLGAVVTDHLYRTNPDVSERGLAKLRAGVVNMNALAEVARGLGTDGLGPHLLMGEHEEASGGRDKSSVLADALEALVGAVYVEHGIDATSAVVHRLFDPRMAEVSAGGGLVDWKTRLYELTDTMDLSPPEYLVDSGDREYTATVMVAGRSYGPEIGRTKREAEQNAAKTAYRELSP